MDNYLETLSNEIRKTCTAEQYAWFTAALDKLKTRDQPLNQLTTLITQAQRNTGTRQLTALPSLKTSAGSLYTDHWSATDASRVSLLLSLIASRPEETINIVNHTYKLCDEAEHVSIIKGLALYTNDDSLKSVALEAGRTNSLSLLSALTLNNPYPAAHYSEQEFNQLVLKALFTGLNIDALQNLHQRANPELSRMAEDYMEERVAADRDVPSDIWLALAPHCSEQGEKLLIKAISDHSAEHRYYSAKAISERITPSPEIKDALAKQLTTETNNRIREMLQKSLES